MADLRKNYQGIFVLKNENFQRVSIFMPFYTGLVELAICQYVLEQNLEAFCQKLTGKF